MPVYRLDKPNTRSTAKCIDPTTNIHNEGTLCTSTCKHVWLLDYIHVQRIADGLGTDLYTVVTQKFSLFICHPLYWC
jgi:hypothetical protein